MRRNGKPETRVHPRGIALDRRIEINPNTGKLDNLVKARFDFRFGHAQNRTVKKDVFASRQVGVKPRAQFN